MKKEDKINYLKLLLIIFGLTLLDLITKTIFTNKSYLNNSLISINYTQNYGSSFGLFSNMINYSLLISLISIITLIIVIYYRKDFFKNKYLKITFVLFIAGILGNTYDRLIYGYVRDFISLKYLFIFNFADFYFTLAALSYIVYEIKKNNRN
jgi:signal peptidase II